MNLQLIPSGELESRREKAIARLESATDQELYWACLEFERIEYEMRRRGQC